MAEVRGGFAFGKVPRAPIKKSRTSFSTPVWSFLRFSFCKVCCTVLLELLCFYSAGFRLNRNWVQPSCSEHEKTTWSKSREKKVVCFIRILGRLDWYAWWMLDFWKLSATFLHISLVSYGSQMQRQKLHWELLYFIGWFVTDRVVRDKYVVFQAHLVPDSVHWIKR